MQTAVLLMTALCAAIGVAGWVFWRRIRRRKHDPIEYFAGWDGYTLPIRLTNRITKQEANAIAAGGNAYLIGFFDGDGRLIRDVKLLRDEVFFEHRYEYYPSGKLRSVRVTNPKGIETMREYPEGVRPTFFW